MWPYLIIPTVAALLYGVIRYAIRRGDKLNYDNGYKTSTHELITEAAEKMGKQLDIASEPNPTYDDINGMFGEGKL